MNIKRLDKQIALVWKTITHKHLFYRATLMAVVASIISAVAPYLFGVLVDVALQAASVAHLMAIVLLWCFAALASDLLTIYSKKNAYELGIEIYSQFHVDVAQHCINLPLQFHKERRLGELIENVNRGVHEISGFVEETLFSFFPTMLAFVVSSTILFFVEWHLATVLFLACGLFMINAFRCTAAMGRRYDRFVLASQKAFGDRHDILLNIETIKSTLNEESERIRNTGNFAEVTKRFKHYKALWLAIERQQTFIITAASIMICAIGLFLLRMGQLTPGRLIMFVGYIGSLAVPLSRFADHVRSVISTQASFQAVVDLLDVVPETDHTEAKAIGQAKGTIVFDHVSFGYQADEYVLRNINVVIKAGETIALVGKSGEGKTTFANLIGRYYVPQSGALFLDDININDITLKTLRSNIGVVPQEVVLFNETIRNNIAYGRLTATDDEILAAARAAYAHEFIEAFPEKYAQIVGERGVKLSTGQKQRIAIARALLMNPRILILDEATSGLDSHSESLVQAALANLVKGRTTLIIAHRLSTIKKADKILVLDEGSIREMGRHDDLLKLDNGIYRRFWKMQAAME